MIFAVFYCVYDGKCQRSECVCRQCNGGDLMVMECSVPIYHKEDHQRQRQVHQQKYDAAGTIFLQLLQHLLTGLISACMPYQKEPHHGKGKIVSGQRAKPECTVPKAHCQLKHCVCGIPDQSAIKGYIHSEPCIISPYSRVPIFILKGLEKPDQIGHPEAPYR